MDDLGWSKSGLAPGYLECGTATLIIRKCDIKH